MYVNYNSHMPVNDKWKLIEDDIVTLGPAYEDSAQSRSLVARRRHIEEPGSKQGPMTGFSSSAAGRRNLSLSLGSSEEDESASTSAPVRRTIPATTPAIVERPLEELMQGLAVAEGKNSKSQEKPPAGRGHDQRCRKRRRGPRPRRNYAKVYKKPIPDTLRCPVR